MKRNTKKGNKGGKKRDMRRGKRAIRDGSRRDNAGRNGPQTESFGFAITKSFTFAASTATQTFDLVMATTGFASGSRVNTLASGYELFRVTSLIATVGAFSDTTTSDNSFAMCYLQENTNATDASTYAILSQIPVSHIFSAKNTQSSSLVVKRSSLMTAPQDWYSTTSNGTLLNETTQGKIFIAPRSSSTSAFTVLFRGYIEFSQPTVSFVGKTFLTENFDVSNLKNYEEKNSLLGPLSKSRETCCFGEGDEQKFVDLWFKNELMQRGIESCKYPSKGSSVAQYLSVFPSDLHNIIIGDFLRSKEFRGEFGK